MMNTNTAMELNMDELNTVAGGITLAQRWYSFIDDCCDSINDLLGEEVFKRNLRTRQKENWDEGF